jgi:hypothetical protein
MVHVSGRVANSVILVGGLASILVSAFVYEIGWGFYRRLGKKRDALLRQPDMSIRKRALNSTASSQISAKSVAAKDRLHAQIRKSEQPVEQASEASTSSSEENLDNTDHNQVRPALSKNLRPEKRMSA